VGGVVTHSAETDGQAAVPDESTRNPLVRLDDVHVRYRVSKSVFSREKIDINAVDGVTLEVEQGQTLGLVGATGSGKSTVAHLIMGLVTPSSGTVTISGHDITTAKAHERHVIERIRQVVLQDPYSSLNPRMTVRDIIAEPLTVGRSVFNRSKAQELEDRVIELLHLVGLPENKIDSYPHQFSGGQRQRISIARALASNPKLVVLDEPTSALDVSVRAQVLNLLRKLQEDLGVTYLIVSHDLLTVAYLASTVAVMHRGRIVEIGPTEALYASPRHPRTLELLASVPGSDQSGILERPAGSVEDLPATACKYADRCLLRERLGNPAICVEVDPPLKVVEPDHSAACHFHEELRQLTI
jgi:oligopeptide/dipeptide ABC transporter ATP-binding protein